MNGSLSSFLTDGAALQDYADSSDSATTANYQLWAVLGINILLLIERAFKNSKIFCRCTKDSCTLTNRTPPNSPGVSRDNKDTPSESDEKLNAANIMRAIESIRESMEEASTRTRSNSHHKAKNTPATSGGDTSSEYDSDYAEFMNWKQQRKQEHKRKQHPQFTDSRPQHEKE